MNFFKGAAVALALAIGGMGSSASATTIDFPTVDVAGWTALGLTMSTPDGFDIGGCGAGSVGCLGDVGFDGIMTGVFTTVVTSVDMLFCRACGDEATIVRFFDSASTLIGSFNLAGDVTHPRDVIFAAADIKSFTIDLDFDALESITFTDTAAIPLPAGMPLILMGIASLGILGRRKRRS